MSDDEINVIIENKANKLASKIAVEKKRKSVKKKLNVTMIKRKPFSFIKYGWLKYKDNWGSKWWIRIDD